MIATPRSCAGYGSGRILPLAGSCSIASPKKRRRQAKGRASPPWRRSHRVYAILGHAAPARRRAERMRPFEHAEHQRSFSDAPAADGEYALAMWRAWSCVASNPLTTNHSHARCGNYRQAIPTSASAPDLENGAPPSTTGDARSNSQKTPYSWPRCRADNYIRPQACHAATWWPLACPRGGKFFGFVGDSLCPEKNDRALGRSADTRASSCERTLSRPFSGRELPQLALPAGAAAALENLNDLSSAAACWSERRPMAARRRRAAQLRRAQELVRRPAHRASHAFALIGLDLEEIIS